jgi:hypothetical protein
MGTWYKRNQYLKDNKISYAEYLNTEHWKELKIRKLYSNTKHSCYSCNSMDRLELHHRTYERIGHEWLNDLIWLCRTCHEATHAYERNHKCNLWDSPKRVRKKKHGIPQTKA